MDLNVKSKTYKTSTGENLHDLGLGNSFVNKTPIAQSVKEKVDKLDLIGMNLLIFKGQFYENKNTNYRLRK